MKSKLIILVICLSFFGCSDNRETVKTVKTDKVMNGWLSCTNNPVNKYFSTKEAADNYVKCNAKTLSFNDVWNLSSNKSSDNAYVVISKNDLNKIVKEKLKK